MESRKLPYLAGWLIFQKGLMPAFYGKKIDLQNLIDSESESPARSFLPAQSFVLRAHLFVHFLFLSALIYHPK